MGLEQKPFAEVNVSIKRKIKQLIKIKNLVDVISGPLW